MLAGPYGSQILGDLGAEVIKIEVPERGDEMRTMGLYRVKETSPYFLSINRNKQSVTLDLSRQRGQEIFYDLVKQSDVVFDNFRPGVLEKLHCDYERLRQINPGIICCSVSGYGQDGPYRDRPAFDLVLQAMSGGMSITGEPGGAPVRMGLPIGDLAGGMFAAIAISAALHARDQTGAGQYIDISLLDCQVALLTYVAQYFLHSGVVPEPIGSAHQSVVPYQAFKTQDKWIVVAILTERFWAKFCRILGVPELIDDPRFSTNQKRLEHKATLLPMLEAILLTRPADAWLEAFAAEAIPAGPINTVDRVLRDSQVRHRDMVIRMHHPHYGEIETVGNPIKVADVTDTFDPPPRLGEHTEQVLRDLLHYAEAKIADLRRDRII